MTVAVPFNRGDQVRSFLKDFRYEETLPLFSEESGSRTRVGTIAGGEDNIPVFINEFWTSRQRQAAALHEISYRACFKPQLPRFFIELLTRPGDLIYDPFSGRGTTGIEAGLLQRKVILNDVNPLSLILARPRFFLPTAAEVEERLQALPRASRTRAELDLSMFYHPDTEKEILALRRYLQERKAAGAEDHVDEWIRMVATNRLTGHSSGFFSVYTLPPNQAVSPAQQEKINRQRNQQPEYRDTRQIILRKTRSLLAGLDPAQKQALRKCGEDALFLCREARATPEIGKNQVALTVTSPPFLDVVQYHEDNWLRCWFNDIDGEAVSRKITMARTVDEWRIFIEGVFKELFRITRPGGWVAFEVGEVIKGKVKLEQFVIPAGIAAGFRCECLLINEQSFTKTANIWGVSNNAKGTNSNRIVLFTKT